MLRHSDSPRLFQMLEDGTRRHKLMLIAELFSE